MNRQLLQILLVIWIYCFSLQIKAQSILTGQNSNVQPGDSFTTKSITQSPHFSIHAFFQSPVVGANKRWDFSFLESDSYFSTSVALGISAAPNLPNLPVANVIFKGGDFVSFFQNDSNSSSYKGYLNTYLNKNILTEYTNPADFMRYPFSYGSAYIDTFSYNYAGNNGQVCLSFNTLSVEAIGYGTLITPAGIFNQTLLIKTIQETPPDQCGHTITSRLIKYEWRTPGVHAPLLIFFKDEIQMSATYGGNYLIHQSFGVDIGPDQELCEGETIILKGQITNPPASYFWNDSSRNAYLTVKKSGKYWLQLTRDGVTVTDTVTINFKPCLSPFIPNIITPNLDGLNDKFHPQNLPKEIWSLHIYNRWGQLQFHSADYQNDWPQKPTKDGIYYYLLKDSQSKQSFKGWIEVTH